MQHLSFLLEVWNLSNPKVTITKKLQQQEAALHEICILSILNRTWNVISAPQTIVCWKYHSKQTLGKDGGPFPLDFACIWWLKSAFASEKEFENIPFQTKAARTIKKMCELKVNVHPKMNIYSPTIISFQTHKTLVSLSFRFLDFQWRVRNLSGFINNVLICVFRRLTTVLWVWINMKVYGHRIFFFGW